MYICNTIVCVINKDLCKASFWASSSTISSTSVKPLLTGRTPTSDYTPPNTVPRSPPWPPSASSMDLVNIRADSATSPRTSSASTTRFYWSIWGALGILEDPEAAQKFKTSSEMSSLSLRRPTPTSHYSFTGTVSEGWLCWHCATSTPRSTSPEWCWLVR